MKCTFSGYRVPSTIAASVALFALLGCSKGSLANGDDAETLKQIPILIQQHNYAKAHQLLNQLRADHPNSPGLEKLAQTLAPLWMSVPPRKVVAYDKLTPDDQKLIDDLNKATLNSPSLDVLHQVKQFNLRNPNYPHGWVLQACLALKLNRPIEGRGAARNLIDLGGANSINPTFKALLTQLDKQGWLPVAEPIDQNTVAPTDSVPVQGNSSTAPQADPVSFVRNFFKASGSDSSADESSFYGANVTYFDNGAQDIDFVRTDIAKYHAQYPTRTFTVKGDPDAKSVDTDTFMVTCSVDFTKSDGTTPSQGSVTDQVEVQKQNGQWKIISIQTAPQP